MRIHLLRDLVFFRLVFFWLVFFWAYPESGYAQVSSDEPSASNLRAAAGKIDITPPIGTPLAGFGDRTGPSTGIKDPLRAGVLVFDDGAARVAIVTLDLIDVGETETQLIREAIGERTGIPGDHILVNASHTHGAPRLDAATVYGRIVADKVAGLVEASAAQTRPVTLGYADEDITSCVNRRLLNDEGVAEMKPNAAGPNDRRARVFRVDADGGETVAILFHVACHANVFRNENLEITADYPGFAQHFIEDVHGGAPALYLSGAGANIRPNLPSADGFRSGDDADLEWVGRDVGASVVQASARAASRGAVSQRETELDIMAKTRMVELPGKDAESFSIEIQAVRVGRSLFLTIPGEPFIQYNSQVEDALAHENLRVMVVGYANGSHGYFCTSDSYRFGGYEPGVSKFAPEAEAILVDALIALGQEVL